ncbi:MAG: hypothetical protein HC772_18015, partial [Leptolyngbyaceae cyanobacterium CRU_2_3]|nr:hypothetical protein [Leptolyngbyaceae cyanobacterium CRU_2_3]
MLARTLPLQHVLSGVAIASGVATLFLIGSNLRFVPLVIGATASAAYYGTSTAEDRRTWLEKKTAELDRAYTERIESLESDFKLRIQIWEQEKQDLLSSIAQREGSIVQRQEELAQAREADYQLLRQQQEQLRSDYD